MPDAFGIVCADWSCPGITMSRSVFWARDEMARIPMAKKYNTALRMVHSRAEKALCGWPFVASRDFWLMKLKCINHKGHERAQRNDAQNGSKFAQESRRAGARRAADRWIRSLYSGTRPTKP